MRRVLFLEMRWSESSALDMQPQMGLRHLCLEQPLFSSYLQTPEVGIVISWHQPHCSVTHRLQ